MKKLVKKQEFIDYLLGKTIAVVGNARTIRERGEEIDQHDVIIRFNNFIIKGYEKLVGTKTNIWAHAHICNTKPRMNETFDYQWYPFTAQPHPHSFEQDGINSNKLLKRLLDCPLYFDEDRVLYFSKKLWIVSDCPLFIDVDPLKLVNITTFRPTSGLRILLWLYYNGFQYDHYGFDGLRSRHYFHDPNDTRQYSEVATDWPHHNQKMEAIVMEKINQNKLVEAAVADNFSKDWAIKKFHKVHTDKTDVVEYAMNDCGWLSSSWPNPNLHNLLALIPPNTYLSDRVIRKLTAEARMNQVARSTTGAIFASPEMLREWR